MELRELSAWFLGGNEAPGCCSSPAWRCSASLLGWNSSGMTAGSGSRAAVFELHTELWVPPGLGLLCLCFCSSGCTGSSSAAASCTHLLRPAVWTLGRTNQDILSLLWPEHFPNSSIWVKARPSLLGILQDRADYSSSIALSQDILLHQHNLFLSLPYSYPSNDFPVEYCILTYTQIMLSFVHQYGSRI